MVIFVETQMKKKPTVVSSQMTLSFEKVSSHLGGDLPKTERKIIRIIIMEVICAISTYRSCYTGNLIKLKCVSLEY